MHLAMRPTPCTTGQVHLRIYMVLWQDWYIYSQEPITTML